MGAILDLASVQTINEKLVIKREVSMITSIAANQAKGKKANDVIFGASSAATQAIVEYGLNKVTNATIGAILDESEQLVCLRTVEDVFRHLPTSELVAYAPIGGLPEYLDMVTQRCFEDCRPEGYIKAVATAGGTGVIHHVIHNYAELGDEVLTSDWYWGAYSALCDDNGRKLRTYKLFDKGNKFNHHDFQDNVNAMLEKQKNAVLIINSPAHNPTGFSLTDTDWDMVLDYLKKAAGTSKNIILVVDVAYLDYAGEKNECRQFFKKLGALPANILPIVGYSMSKGYTMYGQRVGAMICVSSSEAVAQEFFDINQYTSRATWSNINRPAMQTMVVLGNDPDKQFAFEVEREQYYQMIKERAEIFTKEAELVGLPILPYASGFFISVPSPDSTALCNELHKANIFLVPLKMGARIAVCAVPKHKIKGMAGKIVAAMKTLNQV